MTTTLVVGEEEEGSVVEKGVAELTRPDDDDDDDWLIFNDSAWIKAVISSIGRKTFLFVFVKEILRTVCFVFLFRESFSSFTSNANFSFCRKRFFCCLSASRCLFKMSFFFCIFFFIFSKAMAKSETVSCW